MTQMRLPASMRLSANPLAVVVLPLPVLPKMPIWLRRPLLGKSLPYSVLPMNEPYFVFSTRYHQDIYAILQ
jgi:hypothetical protein